MRIGFDVTPISALNSGVGTYTANLLASLQAQGDGCDEIVPLWIAPNGAGHNGRVVNKTVWMQTLLPLHLARAGIEVCHFTNSVATLACPCPSVVTIHDMTLWLFPQYHYRRRLVAMRPFVPLAARRAAAVIAVSQATKEDIVRVLKVPAAKVHVIHEAPAPWFRPLGDDDGTLPEARRRYQLPSRFVLYVGTIEPRKNLVRLLEAFAELRNGGVIDHTLVIAGQRGWKHEPVFAAVERLSLQQAVCMLGYVPTELLVALYNLADAFVFPSLYEGFGLPVVEAMACGTPVVTSQSSSMAEIGAGAAELVDPSSPESIAHGLRQVLTNETRRAALRECGLVRAAEFTWAAAAENTRTVYRAATKV